MILEGFPKLGPERNPYLFLDILLESLHYFVFRKRNREVVKMLKIGRVVILCH